MVKVTTVSAVVLAMSEPSAVHRQPSTVTSSTTIVNTLLTMRRLFYFLPLALFSLLPFGSAASTDSIPPISLDELVGINFWWDNYGKHLNNTGGEDADQIRMELEDADFFRKLDAVGFVREFHDWYIHEGINTECANANESPSPLYPNSQYKFRVPYQYQASGLNHDVFYECLLNEMGTNYCTDMLRSTSELVKNYVGTTCGAEEKLERLPVNGTDKFDAPESYEEFAAYLYQFANRYGSQRGSTRMEGQIRANLHPDSHASFDYSNTKVSSVTSNALRYMEIWNEPDQWWREAHIPETYIEPQEYAAMLSAATDGHEGRLQHAKEGYPLGVKNADPNIRVVMGGLAALNPCYVEDMLNWFKQQRQDDTNLPFDVVNYHHYSRNGGVGKTIEDYCAGGDLINARWDYGVSPEEDGLKEKLTALRKRLEAHSPELRKMEFWLSEFGYDTHLGSPQAAISERDPITGENNFRQNLDNYRGLWTNPIFTADNKKKIRESLELTQAQWLLRTYLEVASSGWQRAVAYEFGDRAVPIDYDQMHWNSVANRGEFPLFQTSGLFYFDPTMPPAKRYQPKMAYFYVKSFKTLLTDYQYVKEEFFTTINDSCNDAVAATCPRIYQFSKQEDEILRALWLPTSTNETREIWLPLAENTLTASLIILKNNDEDGVETALEIQNGKVKVTLSETPVFLRTTLQIKPLCEMGSPCDDGIACTENDVFVNEDCLCQGIFADSDNDGICNAEDDCDGQSGDLCNDQNPCTINDKLDADCNCIGTFADADNDGICDAEDNCMGTVGDLCNDQNPCTVNDKLDADCNCVGTFADADNDGICDAEDNCMGSTCDDGNPCTENDRFDDDCNCIGDAITGCGNEDENTDNSDNENNDDNSTNDFCNNLEVVSTANGVIFNGLNAPIVIVKAFSPTWQLEYECNGFSDQNCLDGLTVPLTPGLHNLQVQFFDEDGQQLCIRDGSVIIELSNSENIDENDSSCSTLGQPCDDNDICTENDTYNTDCQCIGTPVGDSDNDGVCDKQDICAGSNDNEDENNNGIPDGCEFAGDDLDCNNIQLKTDYNYLKISGMTANTVVAKVFDPDWNVVYMCSDLTDNPCPLAEELDIAPGTYFVQVQFYDHTGDLYCLRDGGVFIPRGIIKDTTDKEIIANALINKIEVIKEVKETDEKPAIGIENNKEENTAPLQKETISSIGENQEIVTDEIELEVPESTVDSIVQDTEIKQKISRKERRKAKVAAIATKTAVPVSSEQLEGCNFVGQFCDDGDPCTTNDRYDTDCNCVGTTADSDKDGVCDVEDICPGSNDHHDRDGDGIPDGCDPINCDDIEVTTAIGQVEIANLEAPNMIVKLFDDRYQVVYECTNLGNEVCEDVQLIEVEKGGVYYVEVQYFDENKAALCRGEFGVSVPTEEIVEINQKTDIPDPLSSSKKPATIEINDREIDFKAGLKAPVNANDLTLFPNPTTGILTIKSKQKVVDWRIYDSSGREVKVYQPIGAYEWTLSVADLPKGTYLVHLRGMKGGVSYGRFIRG